MERWTASLVGATALLASTLRVCVALSRHSAVSLAHEPVSNSTRSSPARLPARLRFSEQMCSVLDIRSHEQREMIRVRKTRFALLEKLKQQRTELAAEASSLNLLVNSERATAPAESRTTLLPPDLCKLDERQMLRAKCPPGTYMSQGDRETREKRLLRALCVAKKRGWVKGIGNNPNATPLTNDHYQTRHYMTYESTLWPKPAYCKEMSTSWWRTNHPDAPIYRPDFSPLKNYRLQCSKYSVDFLRSWKVASMTFPGYLECEYPGCDWEAVPSTVHSGYKALAAVRNPLSRWISAASELLERAINGYCPNGPCTESDGYVNGTADRSTADKLAHQTHWYNLLKERRADYSDEELAHLVKMMLVDTKCNLYTYASEHLSTQSTFLTQNTGPAANLSYVMKLEDADKGLNWLSYYITGTVPSGDCSLVPANVKDCKPGLDKIPTDEDFLKILNNDTALIKDICLVYAQDFVCFDYELPEVCKDMF